MDLWEYLMDSTKDEHSVDINKLGSQGWELVTVVPVIYHAKRQDYKFYFKRKLLQ